MVAIATPGLWTTLKIQFDNNQSPELEKASNSLWCLSGSHDLVRSRSPLPSTSGITFLELFFKILSSKSSSPTPRDAGNSSGLLIKLCKRIISYPSSTSTRPCSPYWRSTSFIRSLEDNNPFLQREYGPMITSPDMQFFETLPLFKKLRLQSPFDYRSLDLPLERMTSLELYDDRGLAFVSSITVEGCLKILLSCPVLEEMRICCRGDFLDVRNKLEAISLPAVEHRRLKYFRLIISGEITQLLDALTLPMVQDLKITLLGSCLSWNSDIVIVFFAHINESLRTLDISAASFHTDEMHKALLQCPGISKLVLQSTLLSDNFIQLFSTTRVTPYLPCLVSIELDSKVSFTLKKFSVFLKTMFKRIDCPPLQSLDIRCRGETPQFIDSHVFKKLKAYEKGGRSIRIDTEYVALFPRSDLIIRRLPVV
ncbi:hypothetical protein CPB84DRAFT_1776845 [Gymnopilus junonius]|uniref:Uncharacterized protein n=1 Tax=Gymnopilus junonius TaxID=109634 RepID=A0A9P5TPG8_GYMJU|nr:hypothetical protein CPB84DRAFT_1776845 [Gymnopilus junonius]